LRREWTLQGTHEISSSKTKGPSHRSVAGAFLFGTYLGPKFLAR